MRSSKFLRAIARACRQMLGGNAQTSAMRPGGHIAGGLQRIVTAGGAGGTHTRAAERLKQEMQLLEDLKSKGDLISFRAAEQRIVWEELTDLERETVWMEFDDTIERITSSASAVARHGKAAAEP